MQRIIEIGGHTTDPIGKVLSNFTAHSFVIDGIRCASMEGFLQALKYADQARQREICQLVGMDAKQTGQAYNTWKKQQTLHWTGTLYSRTSRAYLLLISRAYDEMYRQCKPFRTALLHVGPASVWHSIGSQDQRETVLTEAEMLVQIERLARRAIYEELTALSQCNY